MVMFVAHAVISDLISQKTAVHKLLKF